MLPLITERLEPGVSGIFSPPVSSGNFVIAFYAKPMSTPIVSIVFIKRMTVFAMGFLRSAPRFKRNMLFPSQGLHVVRINTSPVFANVV